MAVTVQKIFDRPTGGGFCGGLVWMADTLANGKRTVVKNAFLWRGETFITKQCWCADPGSRQRTSSSAAAAATHCAHAECTQVIQFLLASSSLYQSLLHGREDKETERECVCPAQNGSALVGCGEILGNISSTATYHSGTFSGSSQRCRSSLYTILASHLPRRGSIPFRQ